MTQIRERLIGWSSSQNLCSADLDIIFATSFAREIMSVRREIRLRKEFLFKKQQESVQILRDDKKRKLKSALDEGKSIPTEMVGEARQLNHELELDVNPVDGPQNIDDEYSRMGLREPKVCITTSRDPSSRLKQFSKEVKLCIPNAQAVNRGNHRTDELIEACKKADFTDVIILNETRGMPDAMIISHLPFGPTAYFTLSSCVLRHDIPESKPASQQYPHLILDGLNSKIGQRVGRIIQALYPVPRVESQRVITYANNNDFISFRHHTFNKDKGEVVLSEAGPRFEMQPYEVSIRTTLTVTDKLYGFSCVNLLYMQLFIPVYPYAVFRSAWAP
jgi:U3 small nucleolar ribonucleoprotein protein IMP4